MLDYQALMEQMGQEVEPPDLGKQLRPLISSDGPLLRALALVLKQATELSKGLATIDFTTDEGRLKAIRQQGVIEGLIMSVEIMTSASKGVG